MPGFRSALLSRQYGLTVILVAPYLTQDRRHVPSCGVHWALWQVLQLAPSILVRAHDRANVCSIPGTDDLLLHNPDRHGRRHRLLIKRGESSRE